MTDMPVVACSVCGAEVDVEVGRETVPSDWEYRYAARLMHYYEPGTHDEHRCRLTPRRYTLADFEVAEELEAETSQPDPPRAPDVPGGWGGVAV